MRHGARTRDFRELLGGLEQELANGNVRRRFEPETGLSLWVYAEQCVYERAWNEYSLLARGLILHEQQKRVVATPFPKFFNVGERSESIPNMAFETFEKLDGSLIIIYNLNGQWRTATKGSFDSEQAQWARARLAMCDLTDLEPGTTYLAEAVYPENRIVVLYPEPALVMLAAYREDGSELPYADI
jgi:RNA ligase